MPKASLLREEDKTDQPAPDNVAAERPKPKAMSTNLAPAGGGGVLALTTPGPPPMRPRLDSEAAGHWPMGFAQTEETRAALANLVSPIGSGTAAMPRPVVDNPLLRARMETGLAKTERAIVAPYPSAPRVPESSPVVAQAPPFPSSSGTRADRARDLGPSNAAPAPSVPVEAPSSRRNNAEAPKPRSLSPVAVFLTTFVIVGGLLGGIVAVQQAASFGRSKPAGPVTSSEPSASGSAPTADSADAPATTASSSVSATGISSAPPPSPPRRTRPRPRRH